MSFRPGYHHGPNEHRFVRDSTEEILSPSELKVVAMRVGSMDPSTATCIDVEVEQYVSTRSRHG
jgi:hypothetical protein